MSSPLVDSIVARIHSRRPLRAWSLIVTIYGDAIVPRGGSLWLGSLLDMMATFDIDSGVVRTAMSRLAKDGWIERRRVGRQSYYRLSGKREQEFAAAAEQIYAIGGPSWDGSWTVALLEEGPGPRRQERRASMKQFGFTEFAPSVLLRPNAWGNAQAELACITLEARSRDAAEARRLAQTLWPLGELSAGYRRFIDGFTPVQSLLGGQTPGGLHAFMVRIGLIHEYRRLVLHDPALPTSLLPDDWPGTAARRLARDIYGEVLGPSESWLDKYAKNETGPLPPPLPALFRRFGARREAEN